jgi:hypothetical protein
VQDDTKLIQASTLTYLPPDHHNSDEENAENEDVDHDVDHDFAGFDHAYSCTTRLSLFTQNVMVYVAGWVVRKLLTRVKCEPCQEGLVELESQSLDDESHKLLRFKQKGGLKVPSASVVKIVTCAEKHLRSLSDIHIATPSLSMKKIEMRVLAEAAGINICDPTHSAETQEGIDNHNISLIRLIASTFLGMRQHHIVKLHNERIRGRVCRYNLTKTILFKGQ